MIRYLYLIDTSTGDARKIAVPYNGEWTCVDSNCIEEFLNNHDITKLRFEVRETNQIRSLSGVEGPEPTANPIPDAQTEDKLWPKNNYSASTL